MANFPKVPIIFQKVWEYWNGTDILQIVYRLTLIRSTDRNTEKTTTKAFTGVEIAEQEVQKQAKPKWRITKPSYLSEYVWGTMVNE